MPCKVLSKADLDLQRVDWLGLHREYLVNGEMEVICALLRGIEAGTAVEFGCRDGRTAAVILRNVPSILRYVGVDVPLSYQPGLSHQRREMVSQPGRYALHDPRFELMIRDNGTLDLEPRDIGTADAVFIDGDHSGDVVSYDSELAKAIVRPGGLVIWHDAQNDAVEVRRTLDRLIAVGWPIQNVEQTWLAVMRV